jgi:hypothetical protein
VRKCGWKFLSASYPLSAYPLPIRIRFLSAIRLSASTRFLMVRHGEPLGPREVRVVLNWAEELRGLVTEGGME